MSDLRQTLTDVLSGKLQPEKFLDAVDEYLAKPGANLDALRSAIDAAEHLGLREDIAKAARERIVAGGADRTQVVDTGAPADNEKTVLTTNQQATQLRGNPADVDPDRTVAMEKNDDADSERTVALDHDDDATIQVGGHDPDATVQVGGHDPDATVQVGGGGGGNEDDPFAMAGASAADDELGPGSVLKGRFRLEQVIGQGGMGAVYKAVDLLKVEARDRNPYIAVKLLIGDFKEHPEAFIALQRESAKAQRLAHPNIATVYDFDRDGETVYMTMELMLGAELAKYIKKLPAGGLPVEDANRIIEQLCAGLAYAHGRGLVHSDFKPGNAFVLEDGTVKLLDFGIARASKTKADAEGESTVFDPGQLGALTPAYATIEMFEGEDPDPRDDIYALACVAYELYTGKHPFNKMSAVKARDKGLKPTPVPKLNKRQNRTLLKGLALARPDRIGSVEEFWEGVKPRKDYTLQIAAAATAGVLLVGVLAYNPVLNFFHEREHAAILAEIDSGDDTRLAAALEQIDALPADRQLLVADRGVESIIRYFQERAEAYIDPNEGLYNYSAALQELGPLDRYFPDSARVANIRGEIEQRRSDLIVSLRPQFNQLLADGRLMPDPDAQDLTEIVAVLRQVDPESDMLNNVEAVTGYRELANAALAADDWSRAAAVLEVGLNYSSRNPDLLDLESRVSTELRRREEAARVATLQQTIRNASPQALEEFRAVRDELRELGELRPADELVRSLDAPLRQAFARAMADATSSGNWAQADALLADFATVLPLDYLTNTRQTITQRQVDAGVDTSDDATRVADLTQRAASIRQLLADASFDDDFARQLNREYKEYIARTTSDTDEWQSLRTEIAMAHIERSRELVAENRFGTAGNLLDVGEVFYPTLPEFGTVRDTLAAAESAYRAEQTRLAEVQRIDGVKNSVREQAEAGQVIQARQAFDGLREILPADDPFIATEGPQILADAYASLAQQAGDERNEYGTAVDLARAGLQVLPDSEPLQQLVARFQTLADRAEVAGLASNLTPRNFAAFRSRYTEVRNALAGGERTAFENQVASAVSARLTALDRANQRQDANELKRLALELLPGNARIAQTTVREPERPSQFAPRITAAMGENNLTEARRLLTEGNRAEPNHSQLAGFDAELTQLERDATGLYTRAQQALARGDRAGAQNLLDQALAIWADSPQITAYRDQNFRVTTAPQAADDGSRPCASNLAGLGTSARAACFDMVAGQRAPVLVVIPAASGGQPFAIGKFEVSVSDWNHYCTSSGACQSRGDADRLLPVTGISVQQAEAYVAWLSANTRGTYRLPTDAEWRHAADANGNPGSTADNNCRVVQGGNVIVGATLRNINTSSDNGWGVRNHVGNAREWTRGSALQVRGGGHTTSLTECSVDFVEAHSGSADEVTGFRVARNIDN